MVAKSMGNVKKAEANKRIEWDSSRYFFFVIFIHYPSLTPFYDSNGAGNRSGIYIYTYI